MYRSVLTLVLLVSPFSAQAERATTESWYKSGVSYDQYRSEAVQFAMVGYSRDVSQDEPAKRFIRGWRTADDLLNAPTMTVGSADSWSDAVRRTQPDRKLATIQGIMVNDVETCLTEKGYRKFTLTRVEQRRLSKFRSGTESRHRYLYSLASMPR